MTPRPTAERWFLHRGLPAVLTRRARWRGLWPRSAPVFTGYAVAMVMVLVNFLVTGDTEAEIIAEAAIVRWVDVLLITVGLPVAVLAGWLVSRLRTDQVRSAASAVAVGAALVAETLATGVIGTLTAAVSVVAVLALTASGLGSVLGWALKLTMTQIAVVGALVLRALPLVLLTMLAFFNPYLWSMASTISPARLLLAMLFLGLVAGVFLVSGTIERARPVLATPTEAPPELTARLRDTPFEAMDDHPAEPLTHGERLNVFFVLAVSQLARVLTVAVLTGLIYLILGSIVLSPELLPQWTAGGTPNVVLLGMAMPVPQALLQVSMFLGALTFMYVGAQAVGPGEHRAQFLDPFIDDLRLTLIARNRYRAHLAC